MDESTQNNGAPDIKTNAQILANAIRKNEGGDDYNAIGDGGKSWGAYQFGQGAWQNASQLAGVSSPWGKASPDEQNAAADAQIRQWLSEGKSPPQIASMWNAGVGEPDAYTGKFSNGQPSVNPGKFNVPDYTKKVLNTASELYQNHPSNPQNKSTSLSPTDTALAIGGGSAVVGGIAALAPEIAGGESILGGIGNAIKGGLADIGLSNLFGGNSQQQESQQVNTQSPVYTALQSALSSTIGGQQIQQEAKNRGADPIQAMMETGAVPQPDENGNLDKATPHAVLSGAIAQDKEFQGQAAAQMHSPTNLSDLRNATRQEVAKQMEGSPELPGALAKVDKIFDSYHQQYGVKNGKRLNIAQTFVNPSQLQLMKDRVSEGDDWSAPYHERKATQHTYTAMKNRLSTIAKQEGVKGWDETNKRMETRILARKALKKMPKKAVRNRKKELIHDVGATLAGAAIGKAFGHRGIVGGLVGHYVENKLRKPQYKSLGSSKEQETFKQRAKQKQSSLLHT